MLSVPISGMILRGDCGELLRLLPDHSVDAIVTDPPAGIGFMGKGWDSDRGGRDAWVGWLRGIMTEALRVLRPGAHALVWALPRTSHWTATALEDAGFEIRDIITHHHATGFPKSLDVAKKLDALAGAEREVSGVNPNGRHPEPLAFGGLNPRPNLQGRELLLTTPATEEAKRWSGWGTALKPATENWILARKPLTGTVAANVLEHGTGALNIGGSRTPSGRWPANVVFSHAEGCDEGACLPGCPVAELDAQSGQSKSRRALMNAGPASEFLARLAKRAPGVRGHDDEGGASRFYYVPKPTRSEKDAGLDALPERTLHRVNPGGLENDPRWAPVKAKNSHVTVKAVTLMRYLCRLITPPSGIILDLFAGSGSTGVAALQEGFRFVGIEAEEEYVRIAEARLIWAAGVEEN